MDRFHPRWQAAIALTAVGVVAGAFLVSGDGAVSRSGPVGTSFVLPSGFVTVLAARATDGDSPLTAD